MVGWGDFEPVWVCGQKWAYSLSEQEWALPCGLWFNFILREVDLLEPVRTDTARSERLGCLFLPQPPLLASLTYQVADHLVLEYLSEGQSFFGQIWFMEKPLTSVVASWAPSSTDHSHPDASLLSSEAPLGSAQCLICSPTRPPSPRHINRWR